jgi:ABC-type antimicrobial peptide transport system permease subunit
MFKAFISELNTYIEPVITPLTVIICASILIVSYFASLFILRGKVLKVNMVDSLKDSRE